MFLSEVNFWLPVKTKSIFIGCLHISERRSSATNQGAFIDFTGFAGRRYIFPSPQPLPRLCTNPLPVKHPVTIQDGGIEPIYLAFRILLQNIACTAGYLRT